MLLRKGRQLEPLASRVLITSTRSLKALRGRDGSWITNTFTTARPSLQANMKYQQHSIPSKHKTFKKRFLNVRYILIFNKRLKNVWRTSNFDLIFAPKQSVFFNVYKTFTKRLKKTNFSERLKNVFFTSKSNENIVIVIIIY